MLRHVMPAAMVAAGLLLAPTPALAHAEGGGDMDFCKDEAKADGKGMADCCAAEGDEKNACCEAEGGAKSDCCEDEDGHGMKDGHGDKSGHHGMMGRRGMKGHHGMMGGHGMMMGHKQFAGEFRYLPVFYNSTNQWLIHSHGMSGRKNDVFSLGFQQNLAVQTFNNGPAGFWVAPYCGILPSVGYTVGDARADLGLLVGAGGMARTANVGGTADVLQARLMWVLEPRAELMWQGEGHGFGLTGTYLMTQHMADLGGFTFGVKATFGGGKGMGYRGDKKDRKDGDDHKGHKH